MSETNRRYDRGRTLIVVEDSDSAAATLEIALEGLSGIEVVRFRRAEDALARIERDGGACRGLVTDLHLAGMDGFELVGKVRERRAASVFPIVVVSGDGDTDTPERVRRLGANAFFRKPFSPVEVRRTLEDLLDETEDPSHAV